MPGIAVDNEQPETACHVDIQVAEVSGQHFGCCQRTLARRPDAAVAAIMADGSQVAKLTSWKWSET